MTRSHQVDKAGNEPGIKFIADLKKEKDIKVAVTGTSMRQYYGHQIDLQ